MLLLLLSRVYTRALVVLLGREPNFDKKEGRGQPKTLQ
jgi:hypothetical protein